MTERILCVDDDANILDTYQRTLRKRFNIETALAGRAGLEAVAFRGPYAAVVSDMRMPGMNGIEFLRRVRELAPSSVRVMLTGYADVETVIEAVNEGNIFRFLTKPCHPEVLAKALSASLEQYRLIQAEGELLENTLGGCIRVLTEILSAIDPQSFGRTQKLSQLVKTYATEAAIKDSWKLDLAAMVSRIGLVTIPPSVIFKSGSGEPLSEVEETMLSQVPEIGRKLLSNIPRMEPVAEIVLYQNKCFDGSGFPEDSLMGEEIPLGARILKVLSDLVHLEANGLSRSEGFRSLRGTAGCYDPAILESAAQYLSLSEEVTAPQVAPPIEVGLSDLRSGDVLFADLQSTDGCLLLSAGHVISEMFLQRLRNIAQLGRIPKRILIKNLEPQMEPETALVGTNHSGREDLQGRNSHG